MFKKFIMPLGIAALIAALLAMASDRRGFEELAVRAAFADEARAQGSKCPLSADYTDKAHHNVLAIALANKLARIALAVLNKERKFEVTRTTAPSSQPA